ncbi:MAG: hypothetical protein WD399_06000, partial [Thermoleophilaceae bacterium]
MSDYVFAYGSLAGEIATAGDGRAGPHERSLPRPRRVGGARRRDDDEVAALEIGARVGEPGGADCLPQLGHGDPSLASDVDAAEQR